MATQLKSYDFDAPREHVGRPPKYPWHEWLDGRIMRVVEGKDITTIPSFRSVLTTAARRYNKRIRSRVERRDGKPDRLVFQAKRKYVRKEDKS